MIEKIPIVSREQWEKLRSGDVTASTAGCLLGIHDYMTPFRLYAEKTGKVTDQIEASPSLERGILLEPVALALYMRERPATHIEWNGLPGQIDGVYLRDPALRIGATIDARAFDEDRGGHGIVQFKTVEAGVFRRKWRAADDDPEPAVPLYIAVQAIVEAHLAGAQWAQVAALVVSHGIDLHVIDVPLHKGVFAKLCEQVKDFWRRVEKSEPPPPDYAQDGLTISRLYDEKPGSKMLDLTGDNRMPEVLARRETLMTQRKLAEDGLEEIKNELRFKIGNNAGAICRGFKLKRHHVAERIQKMRAHYRITVSKGKDNE